MRTIYLLGLLVLSVVAPPTSGQTTSVPTASDPQAVAILAQALNAAGGASAIGEIQDFTGTGNITYYWAGQQVSGVVTVRGLGLSYFRLDAQLPAGMRSWIVTGSTGTIKNSDGSTQSIQYANAVILGCLTLPHARIQAALSQASGFAVSMAGTVSVSGVPGTAIQIQTVFSSADDPTGDLTRLNTQTYVFDPQTYALLAIQNALLSDDGRNRPIAHEIDFSNSSSTNGLTIPFSITEMIDGQKTWSLQLTSMTFNSGLTASTFQF